MNQDFAVIHVVTSFQRPAAARRGGARLVAPARRVAGGIDFATCMEIAFGGVVMLGALLFAVFLLRYGLAVIEFGQMR
jgi:hypothetical protein